MGAWSLNDGEGIVRDTLWVIAQYIYACPRRWVKKKAWVQEILRIVDRATVLDRSDFEKKILHRMQVATPAIKTVEAAGIQGR